MLLFKVIPYLMPFIKEMLIGKKTWTKAFKENRSKTVMALVIIASILLNLVLMVKVGSLAFSYLELSRVKEQLEHRIVVLEKSRVVPEGSAKIPITNSSETVTPVKTEPEPPTNYVKSSKPNKSTKAAPVKKIQTRSEAERIKIEFDRLQRQEEIEQLLLEGKMK